MKDEETMVKDNHNVSNREILTLDDAINHLNDTLGDSNRKWSCESCRQEHIQLRDWLIELRNIKTSNITPVNHGRWIMPLLMEDGHIHAECSHCHKIRIIDDYCSACGAVMDLEDTED